MVDFDLSEEEQAERLKKWWKENATSIIVGVVIGVGAIVGINLWRDYQTTQSESASGLYEHMLSAYRQQQPDQATATAEQIVREYTSSPYAGKAGLLLAKIHYENKDIENTEARLRWVIDNAVESATAHAARLRLGRVLLAEGKIQQVKNLLAVTDYGGFESEYKELEGDLYFEMGAPVSAKSAYQRALEMLADGSNYEDILLMKLDNVATEASE